RLVDAKISGGGDGCCARNDKRGILINSSCVYASVLYDVASADAHRVIAWQRAGEVDPFHIVDRIRGRGVWDRFTFVELISTIEAAVWGDYLEVQIVHQRGRGAGESGQVRVGEGDFKGL